MHTVAEIRIEPIGSGPSTSHIVEQACAILKQSGMRCRVHEMGTNVEGDLADVLESVREVHRQLHDHGIARISTRLEFETRTDKDRHLDEAPSSEQDLAPAPRLA